MQWLNGWVRLCAADDPRPCSVERPRTHVDPGADGFDPSPLIPYCARLGVPYFYEEHNLLAVRLLPATARHRWLPTCCVAAWLWGA